MALTQRARSPAAFTVIRNLSQRQHDAADHLTLDFLGVWYL